MCRDKPATRLKLHTSYDHYFFCTSYYYYPRLSEYRAIRVIQNKHFSESHEERIRNHGFCDELFRLQAQGQYVWPLPLFALRSLHTGRKRECVCLSLLYRIAYQPPLLPFSPPTPHRRHPPLPPFSSTSSVTNHSPAYRKGPALRPLQALRQSRPRRQHGLKMRLHTPIRGPRETLQGNQGQAPR